MTNQTLDQISELVFFVLGLLVLLGSLGMPRFEAQGAFIYQAPGLTPGLLGISLAICGLILAMRRGRADASSLSCWEAVFGTPRNRHRALAALGLTLAYGAVLFGNVPFILATFLFVFCFVATFELLLVPDEQPRRPVKSLSIAVALGLITAFVSQYMFQTLFLVQLP